MKNERLDYIIRNALVRRGGLFVPFDVHVKNGVVSDLIPLHGKSCGAPCVSVSSESEVFDFDSSKIYIFPGFADVHVHLREPGFSYKATIASETHAAAAGGYTTVCAMPNLSPPPDSVDGLRAQLDIIERDAAIEVKPYGTITKGRQGREIAALEEIAPYIAAFSDDGSGVQDEELMKRAMLRAKALGKIIAAHCEDNTLLEGGYIHKGRYAAAHGHKGISSESEWRQVERDIKAAAETGCAYHVCHISTAESVDLIRKAKSDGVDVSCETAPHYLLLCEDDLREDGNWKMNPPLRSERDRDALLQGLCDGTIDMIATDHAPHSAEEKSRGLAKSAMGIVGLETAFPLLYTYLVERGIIPLERLIELMSTAPRRRFGLTEARIEVGSPANFTVFDLGAKYEIAPERFLGMGHSTPFEGTRVRGRCEMTVLNGNIIFKEKYI